MLYVFVRCEVAGVHCWPECSNMHTYLKSVHRHNFIIEVELPVVAEHREIEIFEIQDQLKQFVLNSNSTLGTLVDFGEKSCETIAREVAEYFGATKCIVSEDGVGGACYVR